VAIRAFNGVYPNIGAAVYIDDSAVVIGDVTLADDVSVWPTAVIRGDVHGISIGEGTNVQDGSVLHVSHDSPYQPGGFPLRIGRGVTIGHRAVVHACSVGEYCLLGIGAVIMDGAVLGDYTLLGAGALVPPGKTLDGGFLYVGAPVKQVRALSDKDKAFLRYSYRHYMHLKDDYLRQASA
jgi:carbonic anhydrase/acetyltransferase-like protein (isoleucine patch superfamily)